MKKSIILFFSLLFIAKCSFSQYPCISDGKQYSYIIETDTSSQNYIMGVLPDKTNKDKYVCSPYAAYYTGNAVSNWTNLIVYNSSTRKINKLFSEKDLVSISPVTGAYGGIASYRNQNLSVCFGKYILLCVKTDEYSKDGVIDENDPLALYICSNDGNNLTQITPKNMNVTEWYLSTDRKMLISKMEKDKNGDKHFKNEDEVIYQIDLNEDFNKIKATAISID